MQFLEMLGGNFLGIFWKFFGNSLGIGNWKFYWNSLGILREFFENSVGIVLEFFGDVWLGGSECVGVDFGYLI